MNKGEVFRIWAPPESPWSRWVKPVLFAHVGAGSTSEGAAPPEPALDLSQVVPQAFLPGYRTAARADNAALVVELPGAGAVSAGLALARLGFRPVPLFNAYPAEGMSAAVGVWPIVTALQGGASSLATAPLSEGSPPAFLLDADRRGSASRHLVTFDNRSMCAPSDFPTGKELSARGIEHVVVLRAPPPRPFARDLTNVLLALQTGGMHIHQATLDRSSEPKAVVLRPPSLLARLGETLYQWSLQRKDEAGFGRAQSS